MINLGLSRIGRLLDPGGATTRSWRAVHVAGTNGKGSICAYISALLQARGGGGGGGGGHMSSVGMFTSPHLVDRWDCVALDGRTVPEATFRAAEQLVSRRDRKGQVGATEFELLTATAFEVFRGAGVRHGVVEVGLGGALDATNVLEGNKAVTVISKIGLDHQAFLGDTLEQVALHKAGIMRPGVPCVVDGSNPPSVLETIWRHARDVGAEPVLAAAPSRLEEEGLLPPLGFEPHQVQNLACAVSAFKLACPSEASTPLSELLPTIKQVKWPGRLQTIDISSSIANNRPREALLDGAHNVQSAEVLARYVDKHLRGRGDGGVTWVLAASAGKDISGILKLLLRPHDRVAAVRFGPVDGMPWVAAEDPASILDLASQVGISKASQYEAGGSLEQALQWASSTEDMPLVIAGSLYLVSDTIRLLRR